MELQTNPHNPRTISKDAYEKLKRSIERNPDGLTANKIAYKDGIIISGNQRYRAIQELKLDMKPEWLKDLSGWTQEQIDEWVIQSNISAGEWDWDILANEWEADNLIDWGIDMPDDWGTSKELPEDIDEIPEVKTPVSKLGDLWLLNGHRVLCGDSTDKTTVERLMDGKKADMVFTDPPYGVDYDGGIGFAKDGTPIKWKREELIADDNPDIYLKSVPMMAAFCDGPIYTFFADTKALPLYQAIAECGGKIHALLLWVKRGGYGALNANYKQKHEPFLYWKGKKGKLIFTGASTENTIWEIDKEPNKEHPTQKPVSLAARAIGNHKAKTVLDLFLGSGSTLIACEQTDRTCYGLELDPHYVDVICKRWQTLTGQMPILESSGEAHDFMVQ